MKTTAGICSIRARYCASTLGAWRRPCSRPDCAAQCPKEYLRQFTQDRFCFSAARRVAGHDEILAGLRCDADANGSLFSDACVNRRSAWMARP